jgi:hypothetical protein
VPQPQDEVARPEDDVDEIPISTGIPRFQGLVPNAGTLEPIKESRDIAALAAAEGAKALVQGRIIMAIQRPRDFDEVRRRLLNDCKRPRFAEAARYAKPMGGGKVKGWSIRFAEAAVRHLGNIDCRAGIIAQDENKIVLRFDAIDLETNAGFGGEITIDKTVERRNLRPGEVALSVRTNSTGQPTYTVRANEDDLQTKLASAVSKGIRTFALRLVPADILEDCLDVILAGPKEDPAAARKRIVDSFVALGVGPEAIKRLVGIKDLSLLTAAQLQTLRETYTAIREGDLSVEEILSAEPTPDASKSASERLKDKLKKEARIPGEEG